MSQLTGPAQATLQTMVGSGTAFLTAVDGQELIGLNLITVDPSQTSPTDANAFLCTLTEAGQKALSVAPAAPPIVAAVPAEAPTFKLRDDIAVPAIKRGGGGTRQKKESVYPFASMEINQSFHVAPGEDIDKTSRVLSTQVSNANKASRVPTNPPAIVAVTKRRIKKDEAGNTVIGENGKKVMESYEVQEQAMTQTKFFVSRKVNSDDPNGPGIRVFRVAESV